MKKYDLEFRLDEFGSGYTRKSAKYFFPNGYGVSIINISNESGHQLSYTYNKNQYELAVLLGDIDEHEISYDTPIADDVIGYLDMENVFKIMNEIEKLEKEIYYDKHCSSKR